MGWVAAVMVVGAAVQSSKEDLLSEFALPLRYAVGLRQWTVTVLFFHVGSLESCKGFVDNWRIALPELFLLSVLLRSAG